MKCADQNCNRQIDKGQTFCSQFCASFAQNGGRQSSATSGETVRSFMGDLGDQYRRQYRDEVTAALKKQIPPAESTETRSHAQGTEKTIQARSESGVKQPLNENQTQPHMQRSSRLEEKSGSVSTTPRGESGLTKTGSENLNKLENGVMQKTQSESLSAQMMDLDAEKSECMSLLMQSAKHMRDLMLSVKPRDIGNLEPFEIHASVACARELEKTMRLAFDVLKESRKQRISN